MKTKTHEKDLQYYIDCGFDPATAEYFAAGKRTITHAVPIPDYRLELTFDNGEIRLYDVKPFLRTFSIFEPLWDATLFSKVYLDERHSVTWDIAPDISCTATWKIVKVDLPPDTCYINSTPVVNKDV